MSSAAETGERTQRRSRLIWVALALSLTLNICFIGGLVWSKVVMERINTPAHRFQQFGQALHLDQDQLTAFHQFGRTVRERTRLLHRSNRPLLQRIWRELAKPTPDQALVARMVDEAAGNRQSYQKDAAAALAAFMAKLTPDQRAQLADIAEHRHDQLSRRIWWLIVP